MPNAYLSMLLYPVSALVRVLLANAIGCNAMLSGGSSFGNCILSLTHRRSVPYPTPNTYVSRYRGSFHCRTLYIHHHGLSFPHICQYMLFDVQSASAEVNLHSGLHTSMAVGDSLPK